MTSAFSVLMIVPHSTYLARRSSKVKDLLVSLVAYVASEQTLLLPIQQNCFFTTRVKPCETSSLSSEAKPKSNRIELGVRG